MSALKALLEESAEFSRIDQEGDLLIAYLETPLEAQTLNRRCFDQQIQLTHLVKRKESLEQQFLTLTNNQQTNPS